MTVLGILWFILIAVLIAGYFILDGFDLGAGVLSPFVAKDEKEKAIVCRSVGPVWDGNEVWLLTAGGALFAAFAPAYATTFSGFYLAIMLVLFGLIVRAVSLEYRAHDPKWKKLWDALFFLGSLLPALLFGVAIGNHGCQRRLHRHSSPWLNYPLHPFVRAVGSVVLLTARRNLAFSESPQVFRIPSTRC